MCTGYYQFILRLVAGNFNDIPELVSVGTQCTELCKTARRANTRGIERAVIVILWSLHQNLQNKVLFIHKICVDLEIIVNGHLHVLYVYLF